jgi:hypothetical protein
MNGDLEVFAWFVLCAVALFCVTVAWPRRKKRMATRRETVFLPRITAWDRVAEWRSRG